MSKTREAYVLWLDRDSFGPAGLRGSIEHTRRAHRTRFGSTAELLEFLVETIEGEEEDGHEDEPKPEA